SQKIDESNAFYNEFFRKIKNIDSSSIFCDLNKTTGLILSLRSAKRNLRYSLRTKLISALVNRSVFVAKFLKS
ncbi:hypothetical protein, partial [Mycoplasmopsis bovis]|uniref:hypothetical protein n=1 Tax=Mycoplasmopsis bovis TaxID=28903 RepID=UPI003D27AA92